MKQSIHSTAFSGPQTCPVCFVSEPCSWLRKEKKKKEKSNINVHQTKTAFYLKLLNGGTPACQSLDFVCALSGCVKNKNKQTCMQIFF